MVIMLLVSNINTQFIIFYKINFIKSIILNLIIMLLKIIRNNLFFILQQYAWIDNFEHSFQIPKTFVNLPCKSFYKFYLVYIDILHKILCGYVLFLCLRNVIPIIAFFNHKLRKPKTFVIVLFYCLHFVEMSIKYIRKMF